MSAGHLPAMSNSAFAGLLRLLLTPLKDAPKPSAELHAYLQYLNRVTPPVEWHCADGDHSSQPELQA